MRAHGWASAQCDNPRLGSIMKRICAWCSKDLPLGFDDSNTRSLITHGICTECADSISSAGRRRIQEWLDTLAEPVFLVDDGGRIVSANTAAQHIVQKDQAEIENKLGGDVFECANALLPGGCGRTEHCKACTIRNTVMETLASGRGVKNVSAYQDIKTKDGVRQMRFLISTERVGKVVLLRVDDVA